MDLMLLQMPYSGLTQPALATGLLKACLDRAGLSTKVVPANILFAEEIGPVVHDLLFVAVPHTMIGEWTFSRALSPSFSLDDDHYLSRVIINFKADNSIYWRELCRSYPYLNMHKLLREVRECAQPFVERVADEVLQCAPRIVGCTSVFQQHCASLAVLKRIKELSPTTITMIGGANCEGSLGRATFERFPWLDYVASGDADGFIGRLCHDILDNGGSVPAERLPDGVYSRALPGHDCRAFTGSEGVPIQALTNRQSAEAQAAPIAILDNMDEVPIPNYDDWFEALRSSKLGDFIYPSIPHMTSRGCWWGEKHHCTFCGISKAQMKYRAKSADAVLTELFALKNKYGIKSFQGTEYILDHRYFKTLIPRLHEIGGHFRFDIKANLSGMHIEALRNAGVVEVQPGIESLHDDVLQLMDKGTTAALNVRMLKSGVKHGMSIFWNMLHSVPGDRDEWYREQADLIPLLHHLQPPTAFAAIHYDRFSVYWERPEDFQLQLVPAWGYRFVYPFDDKMLLELAYFFDNVAGSDQLFGAADAERLGLHAIAKATEAWQKEFRKLTSEERPLLLLEDLGDQVVITDTRRVAAARTTRLSGLAAHVIKACDDGVSRSGLLKALENVRGRAPAWEEVEPVVEDLIDRKFLVVLTGRYLGLPVIGPVRAYAVDEIDDPALTPDIGLIQADRAMAKQTLAIKCLRSSYDMPITALFGSSVERLDFEPRTIWSP